MRKHHMCFITEVDLDEVGGAATNDLKTLRSLRKLGYVDVIYLQKTKYRPVWRALSKFVLGILKTLPKPYSVYFSRGLITSFILVFLRFVHHKKIVHQALSVPLASTEVAFSTYYNKIELLVRYVLFRFLERMMLPRVDAVTIAEDYYSKELCDVGVRDDKIHVVHFYLEEDFFKQPIKLDVDKSFKFCYIGRFHMYHDLLLLIQAFERLVRSKNDVQLLLVGDGPLRPNVEREIKKHKLKDQIKLLGKLPHSVVPSLLSEVDCFVLLVRARGMPISLLEAAAAGKPIITARRDTDISLNRYFEHEKQIYRIDEISVATIEKAMKLLYENSELRKRLASEARKVAKQYFSESVTIGEFQTLLQNLSGRH